jgi:hypothetical protein
MFACRGRHRTACGRWRCSRILGCIWIGAGVGGWKEARVLRRCHIAKRIANWAFAEESGVGPERHIDAAQTHLRHTGSRILLYDQGDSSRYEIIGLNVLEHLQLGLIGMAPGNLLNLLFGRAGIGPIYVDPPISLRHPLAVVVRGSDACQAQHRCQNMNPKFHKLISFLSESVSHQRAYMRNGPGIGSSWLRWRTKFHQHNQPS